MSVREAMSSLQMTSSVDKLHTLPVEHLDYTYIQKCGDLKYLEKILHVLRSGKEGMYPHLIEFCEKRIESLDPRHRILRKDMCPATSASFSTEEWSNITEDLQAWQREITKSEQQLKQSPLFNAKTLPPVNNRTLQKPKNTTATSTHRERSAVPRAYSDWDRFDVDKECAKIEEGVNNNDAPAVINSAHADIKQHIDTSALTPQEKCVLATREKEKGNESFRANDWNEAIVYYTRSLSILPTVAGFNNRAQAEIKLQRWPDALRDCDAALQIEAHNCKALLRRATAYTHLGKLQAAHDDITFVLQIEPHNIIAQKLLQNVNKKINTELQHKPNQLAKGKKIFIQEVHEERDEKTNDAKTGVDKPAHWDKKGQTDRETKRQMEIKTDEETERKNDGVRHGVDAATARSEGNELYRIGQYGAAAEKYTHGITTLTQSGVYTEEDMFVLYCNRAACFLKMGQCSECVSDCSRALQLKPFGVKALLRRAMAFEALEQFRLAFVDYRTVQQIHNTYCVQQHVNRLTQVLMEQDGTDWRTKLPEVPLVPVSAQCDDTETLPASQTTPNTHTLPTMTSSSNAETLTTMETPLSKHMEIHTKAPPISGPSQTRRHISILEVESDNDEDEDGVDNDKDDGDKDDADSEGKDDLGDDVKTFSPANVFEFGQALNAARYRGDLVACARLMRSVPPHTLPHHISTQLDTQTLSFIIHTLHTHILPTEPSLVYHLLTHLHTAERFTVALMLMDREERRQITQLFDCLHTVECDEFTHENINSLANKFI
ncbi:sperm-associated antigen 1 isoform X1 [Silurus meridionalis]|nr:sperm-associated antigen 1 isoform X1 [Silurus meridionalis]